MCSSVVHVSWYANTNSVRQENHATNCSHNQLICLSLSLQPSARVWDSGSHDERVSALFVCLFEFARKTRNGDSVGEKVGAKAKGVIDRTRYKMQRQR